ncbi:MAG: T9SS type A sorting domain-containing protein [Ignavibacteria bacterium]
MKTKIFILLVINLLTGNLLFAQSQILYNPGSLIDVGSGADVCADAIIINGTYSGSGTICTGALPVSLSSFTSSVNKRDVTLMWVTEYELNNSGFDIERTNITSGGAVEWSKTDYIPGHGTSNAPNGYLFKDEKLKTGNYRYRLKQIDYNGNFEYFTLEGDVTVNPPHNFEMSQNYPNPSNPKSKINFEIPVDGRVTIKVYDIIGREVYSLLDGNRAADYYTVEFDGTNLASGVYFYRIAVEGSSQVFTKTLKMMLIK